MRRFRFIILLLLLIISFLHTQAKNDSLITEKVKNPVGYSLRTHLGGIYKHTPAYEKIGALKNTYAAEMCVILPKTGTHNWHHAFNYPEVIFSLLYTDFGSPYLGKSISALANIQMDAIKSEAYSVYLRMGAGAAFITERFDSLTNPQNEIIGSHINDVNKIGLGINLNFLPNWRFNGGISVTHFSNGSVKKPNRGINLRSIEMGLSYIPSYQKLNVPEYTCSKKRKIGFQLKAGWGLTNQYEYPENTFQVWSTSLIANIFTGRYNSLQLGIGAEYNWYFHRLMNDHKAEYSMLNKEQISVILGDELLFGKTGISYQMHRVINNALQKEIWRTRMGLNHYFNDIDIKRSKRTFIGVGLIAQKFTALYAEICTGFIF